jgi:hypothetical protein
MSLGDRFAQESHYTRLLITGMPPEKRSSDRLLLVYREVALCACSVIDSRQEKGIFPMTAKIRDSPIQMLNLVAIKLR